MNLPLRLVPIATTLLLSVPAARAAERPRERAGFAYRYEPEAGLDRGGHVTAHQVAARAGYPLFRGDNLRAILSVRAQRTELAFDGFHLDDLEVYDLGLPATFFYSGFESTRVFAIVSPGLYSDLETITGDDWRLFGLIMGIRALNETMTLGVGLVFNQDFGSPSLYPALSFNWRFHPQWELDLAMPRPRLIFAPGEHIRFSLQAAPAGDRWSIADGGRDKALELERVQVGLYAECALGKHLSVTAGAGINLNGSVEVEDAGGRRLAASDIDDAPVFTLGIGYR